MSDEHDVIIMCILLKSDFLNKHDIFATYNFFTLL